MKNVCYFLLLLCNIQTPPCLTITTAVTLLRHTLQKQNIVIIHDTHYENYYTVQSKKLKQLIQQQSNEIVKTVDFFSKQKHLSIFMAENNPYYCKHVKKDEKRTGVSSTVANLLCSEGYACSGNLIFLPLDYRCWIDLLILQYTISFYKGLILFKDEPKDFLEDFFKNKFQLDKLSIRDYHSYVDFLFRKSFIELKSLQQQLTFDYLKKLEVEIITAYKNIYNSLNQYVEKRKKSEHSSFHQLVYPEVLEHNNIELLDSMSYFAYMPTNIDFLCHIIQTSAKNIIVQCGSMHAQFLQEALSAIGYDVCKIYGNKNGVDLRYDVNYEVSFLEADLPLNIDKKIIDFVSG